MRLGRPLPGRLTEGRSGSADSETPAGVLGTSCLIFPELVSAMDSSSRDNTDRPRLLDEAVLRSRSFPVDSVGFSPFLFGPPLCSESIDRVWSLAPLPFASDRRFRRRGSGSSGVASRDPIKEGAFSLMGLISSGRGRSGERGEIAILNRGVFFHGVIDPGVREPVSIIGRRGRALVGREKIDA